jgi:hypothetical protein
VFLSLRLAYELSKIEEKPGSPEKPLSDLGRVGYESYWGQVVLSVLKAQPRDKPLSVDDITKQTGIIADDVFHILQKLGVIKYQGGEHVFEVTTELLSKYCTPVSP